ncbi:hypothetical protein NP233_g130 [Leucocoprinus birnbaumii]|uniref:WD40 repeat-like protein n=1 Tax=Leucocoprinus birnbaumii TaxID=56174 RepID=A0AAD5YW23_9AGAR|nr:hypothetical protein NP233_g130 [Leucocoprinus birnbaumii]
MLSVVACDVLAIVEPPALKRSPSLLPPSCTLAEEHQNSAWAADNSALYLASARAISRYDTSSKQLTALHTIGNEHSIRCLTVKDKSTVIYGAGKHIHFLECGGQKPRLGVTLGPYQSDVLSLSLSNDSTLLGCGLANGVYVHNLTTGAQTTLRGLPSRASQITCVFHPHIRTRLMVGLQDQLFTYDTTRPATPMKIIPVNDAGASIQAVACSPFSKTLVAVAMSNGGVGLVDLDKEKGLFRTLDLNVPLTTISFSPEGASIYLGAENGKLLTQDLRALDKPPRSIIVSELGNPITTIAVQKKLKDSSPTGTPKTLTKSMSMTSILISKAAGSPLRSRTTRTMSSSAGTPVRRAPATAGTPKPSASTTATGAKKVLSPTRDPLRNSPRLESNASVATAKVKKPHPLANVSTISKQGASSSQTSQVTRASGRTDSTGASRRRTPSTMIDNAVATLSENTVPEAISSISQARSRTRTVSSTSQAPSVAASATSRTARTVSLSSVSSAASRRKHSSSSTPPNAPAPSISTDFMAKLRSVSPISRAGDESRTPSPDLPDMQTQDVVTPIPAQKKRKAMAVLGLGTPEVSSWIKAGVPASRVSQHTATGKGKARAKSVGFKDDLDDDHHAKENDGFNFGEDGVRERERSLSLQISPQRPLAGIASSSSQPQAHKPSHSWDASPVPLSRSRQTAHLPGTPSAGSAHELLRTIVKDVMYDFQRENRQEMMGLHLDLVRMGRGWKQELRTLMDEYVGDLNDLREENRRLREENERLRRGT